MKAGEDVARVVLVDLGRFLAMELRAVADMVVH